MTQAEIISAILPEEDGVEPPRRTRRPRIAAAAETPEETRSEDLADRDDDSPASAEGPDSPNASASESATADGDGEQGEQRWSRRERRQRFERERRGERRFERSDRPDRYVQDGNGDRPAPRVPGSRPPSTT